MADDLNAHDLLDTAEQATRDAFALAHRAINAGCPAPTGIDWTDGTVTLNLGITSGDDARAVAAWMLATIPDIPTVIAADDVSRHGYTGLAGDVGRVRVTARVAVTAAAVAVSVERTVTEQGWTLTGLVAHDDEEEVSVS